MKLIVILICIALVRYTHSSHNADRYNGLQRYAAILSSWVKGLK